MVKRRCKVSDSNTITRCKKCGSKNAEIEGIAYGVKESEYVCLVCEYSWKK